ncbi:helix-turn-helix transcriptional regulator [Brevundimonas sp.]|uniref:helix-turn-helix transcriptional regulator n=1 Tax=Brevundimonas sp. TaxID=1871086 RepID=UPI002FCB6ACB
MRDPLATFRSPTTRLTGREREVMAYVAAHYRSKMIARLTGKAPKTIDTQIASACRKLGVHNRAEAVRLLLEAGLVPSMGEKPPEAPSPMVFPAGSPPRVATPEEAWNDATEAGTADFRPETAGGISTSDDLWGPERRAPSGDVTGRAQADGAVFGVRAAPAGPVPYRSDGDVRDSSDGELPGRRTSAGGRWLGRPPAALNRLLVALAIAIGLAIALPAALEGAIVLQKLVESLRQP